MKNQDLSIVELISKRNKIVYTVCGLLVLLTILSCPASNCKTESFTMNKLPDYKNSWYDETDVLTKRADRIVVFTNLF